MPKTIAIIGSTGSIGVQALKVVKAGEHRVCALAAGKNARLLLDQALAFRPRLVALEDREGARWLAHALAGTGIAVLAGPEGVCAAASADESDLVLNAVVGIAGLGPTLAAIEAQKTLALANKESLVCAGQLVMAAARSRGVTLLPVDSEHSALFQCLQAGRREEVSRVILTASGGPFFGKAADELARVEVGDALRHPNWSMGAKITIDSATLMNKGFEVIEALYLFDLAPEQIEVVVHRESVVHALVEYCDGATLAQLSPPDMGLAIQYALDWPLRTPSSREKLNLVKYQSLTFFPPDEKVFPALALCREALVRQGNMGAVINGANEAAVALFLAGRIAFPQITQLAAAAARAVPYVAAPTLQDIYDADARARAHVLSQIGN